MAKKTTRKRHSLRAKKRLIFLSLSCALISFIAICGLLFWNLPNPADLSTNPAPASTKILDRHSRLLYEVFSDQRRTPIKLDTLPKYVTLATVAAEDKDFYTHSGFSIRTLIRAFKNTFFGHSLQGGSTITQQLVKLALLKDQSRTVQRKIREFVLSLRVESRYSKDQILELYLNQVPYGGTTYGLESAAQTYFGKPAKDLTLAQAALLAGLPQAPSVYSPFGSQPERAKTRQKYVLEQMKKDGFITEEEYNQAIDAPLNYSTPPSIKAPHFSLWVKDLLIDKYDATQVEQNGLTVITTLDLDLQNQAQQLVASEVAKLKKENVGNGAALVTKPKTGEVLAMVGSKDYFDTSSDGNVNVTLRPRQPGSSIKPISYALAMDRGLITAGTLLADKPTCFNIPNQKPYCPENYDNNFHGPTTVRYALGNSFNIPAVKALVINGLNNFVASSSAMGITTLKDPTKYGPSIALGGGEVTMTDLVTAYGVLANAGKRVDLNPILKITDRNGQVLYEQPAEKLPSDKITSQEKIDPYSLFTVGSDSYILKNPADIRVLDAGTAFIVSHILYDNSARSATFGSSSYLNIAKHAEVSVKTGTTNDKRDNWTVGYTPDIAAAVWVGNNDNSAMSRIASGVTGASPIWNKIMTYALNKYPQNWPTQPTNVTGFMICSQSGLKAPDNPDSSSCAPRYEYFLNNTIPAIQTDNLRRDIPIFKPTQAPATASQIASNPSDIETQNHAVVFDALGLSLCLDCAGGYGEADTIDLNKFGTAIKP